MNTKKKIATEKITATYVDGFVMVVPKKNVAAYKKMAREAEQVWRDFGALDYKECMGQELVAKTAPGMPSTKSFLSLTGAQADDTVWFSFITYKNKKHRNEVNKKVHQYFSKKYENDDTPMPFDMSKMATGGFSVQVG